MLCYRLLVVLLAVFLLYPQVLQAQEFKDSIHFKAFSPYEKDHLPAAFHKKRREELRKMMPDSSVAVFFSAPVYTRSNDVDYEFHQDPDFYYFTGVREPNGLLFIFKEVQDFDSINTAELVFVKERSAKAEVWLSPVLGTQKVKSEKGIDLVLANSRFAEVYLPLQKMKFVLLNSPFKEVEDDPEDRGDLASMQNHFKKDIADNLTKVDYQKLASYTAELRQFKEKEEIELLKKACDITCAGFKEVMRALEPGYKEFQVEALMEYYFKSQGAEFEGYPSICGGAENSCILHYSTNRRTLSSNELIVVDAGAEYHGYTADITRTLPVGGKFSEPQKIIYNIVLEAQMAGIEVCKKGNNFWDPHQAASMVIKKRLKELGIISEEREYIQYFMHGTSHYLGLDVHDKGTFQKLQAGQVITIEPGIYIKEGSPCDPKWWNIGVRIEDDFLITDKGLVNLSVSAPKTVEEIEALMKENSLFNSIRK